MSFKALFYPKSIAVIGASRKPKTVGNDIIKNLITQGYKGKIYPVNPKAKQLYGQQVYASTEELPGEIDLVVVAVPAASVTDVVKDAYDQGAKAAVVISAGFKEIGNVELEEKLAQACHKREMLLVGPNCLGVINPEINMNASFAALMPKKGNIAFISQSGALCTAVLDYAQELGIGFSKFMSIGNKADIDELKLLRYLAKDPQTKVIALYVEQLENAPELIEVVREITTGAKPKPVIILKSGKTAAGAGAIASHTGSLSGGDVTYQTLFRQAGIIRAATISQLFAYAQIFSKNDLVDVKTTTIITNAGGPGVLTTDAVVDAGLKMAKLEPATTKALTEILPAAANKHNPIDILGDAVAERYQKTLEIVAEDKNTDAILLLLTPQSMTEIEATAKTVITVKKKFKKPIIVSFMGHETVVPGIELLKNADVVTTNFPEPAAKSLAVFGQFVDQTRRTSGLPFLRYKDVDREKVRQIFDQAKKQKKYTFPEFEAIDILRAYNFPVLKTVLATTDNEAYRAIKKMGAKVKYAMKIVSQEIIHKSDVGGVMLNISLDNVKDSFAEMMRTVKKKTPAAKLDGVLLMEMAPKNGKEMILGVKKAPGLGTMVMVGLGGIYVEVLKDVSFSFVPLTKQDVKDMIGCLKSSKIFTGFRGQPPQDKEMLIESIGRLAQLVDDFPEIVELDINPLLVLPRGEGVKVLDARVVIE